MTRPNEPKKTPLIERPDKRTKIISKCRTSVIVVEKREILFFKAKDPTSGEIFYFLPGGKPEPGESLESCAIRETFEETGYIIQLLKLNPNIENYFSYPFFWAGEYFLCQTSYFVGTLQQGSKACVPLDKSYHLGPVWLPLDDLAKRLKNTQNILDHIQRVWIDHANTPS